MNDTVLTTIRGDLALVALADAVFVVVGNHTNGTTMSTRAVRYLVDGYLDDLGLKAEGISCHALRHSAATWARAGGAALDSIAGMLGHASVTTTQVYAQIVDRMTENPARYVKRPRCMGKYSKHGIASSAICCYTRGIARPRHFTALMAATERASVLGPIEA